MTDREARALDPRAHAGVDTILDRWHASLGSDDAAYRGHAHRVLAYAVALAPPDVDVEEIAVAAAFHDLGIWTACTFDYLEPSERLARTHLEAEGRDDCCPVVARMIRLHHKLLPARGPDAAMVEAFRRADLVDLSWGAFRLGVPDPLVRESRARWPNAGFHRCLVRVGTAWALRHPLRPLPMLRL